MNLLFITPRFHTNLHYRLKALRESGHAVNLGVLYRGGSENLDQFQPVEIGYCVLYRMTCWVLGVTGLIDPESYRWLI